MGMFGLLIVVSGGHKLNYKGGGGLVDGCKQATYPKSAVKGK